MKLEYYARLYHLPEAATSSRQGFRIAREASAQSSVRGRGREAVILHVESKF